MSLFTSVSEWHTTTDTPGTYATTKEVPWELGVKGSGLWVVVPKGELFDVSIPKGLRWAFNRFNPEYRKAACLHDYTLHKLGWDRVTSAAAFSEALKASGVCRIKRLSMVLAVIAFNFK